MINIEQLAKIFSHFAIDGTCSEVMAFGSGHIHDTYRSRFGDRYYIHQRINHQIFSDPQAIMDNIVLVTAHLRDKLRQIPEADPDRGTLAVIPTKTRQLLHIEDGHHWRTYPFIADTVTVDTIEQPRQAYEIARSFAIFQHLLSDFPGEQLATIIPDFHHPPKRFAALREAIARDAVGRVGQVGEEIEFALARESLTGVIQQFYDNGEIPLRIVHNDTKINNVLLDANSGRGVCVVDIDLVMPGVTLYDIGDLVRSAVLTCSEAEKNERNVGMSLDNFRAVVQGYLEVARDFLTPLEIEHIAVAGKLISFEIAIRFLGDYLDGDKYFKTRFPQQNLARTRTFFQLIREMEKHEQQMREIVSKTI